MSSLISYRERDRQSICRAKIYVGASRHMIKQCVTAIRRIIEKRKLADAGRVGPRRVARERHARRERARRIGSRGQRSAVVKRHAGIVAAHDRIVTRRAGRHRAERDGCQQVSVGRGKDSA